MNTETTTAEEREATTAEEREEWRRHYSYYNRGSKPSGRRVLRLLTERDALAEQVAGLREALIDVVCTCQRNYKSYCYVHMEQAEFDRLYAGWTDENHKRRYSGLRAALAQHGVAEAGS